MRKTYDLHNIFWIDSTLILYYYTGDFFQKTIFYKCLL